MLMNGFEPGRLQRAKHLPKLEDGGRVETNQHAWVLKRSTAAVGRGSSIHDIQFIPNLLDPFPNVRFICSIVVGKSPSLHGRHKR